MAYISKKGKRPFEYASKSSHSNVINDATVSTFLKNCILPKNSQDIEVQNKNIISPENLKDNPIRYIVAIDGSYSEVSVKKEFPSATLTFFQFGALTFSTSDLLDLAIKPFIDPEDMSKLKNIQRLKLCLPTKNIVTKNQDTLINSVRNTIFEFFSKQPDNNSFIETLCWLIFEEYGQNKSDWNLASCPKCRDSNINLSRDQMEPNYSFKCNKCNGPIFLTDVFRLHEAIDNEVGAGGILGYLVTLIEQIVLVHLIRVILLTKPSLLNEILFIKDGPLAFFGQTANMYAPMRKLVSHLFQEHNLYMAGLEKSGSFVEHADEISNKLKPNSVLILDNEYIYKYILPGKADPANPYGRTTYYGNKIIFKSFDDYIYVVTLPTNEIIVSPKKSDFRNIDCILHNLRLLKCDMYDCSLVPIALANKLISLSNHPSSVILEKFAKKGIS